jgi:hypothetical protein
VRLGGAHRVRAHLRDALCWQAAPTGARDHHHQLAAILTRLPTALAFAQDSGIQQLLALIISAGLIIQHPMVLLAMPVLIGISM